MSAEEKPKLIVDDDWKSRVQAEKEQLRSAAADTAAGADRLAQPASQPPDAQGQRQDARSQRQDAQGQRQGDSEELPPPTFESLISMLVTQALVALGQIPIGANPEPVVMLDHAKHYIDLLGMLEEKTKGNLTKAESEMVINVLHEIRMMFVAMQARQ